MSKKISKMGEILLKRPGPSTKSFSETFKQYEPIPCFEKLVFLDEKKEKEWNELPQDIKDFTLNNLMAVTSHREAKLAIDTLCHVINTLCGRLKKLEEKINET